jgi:hypothetical protein
MRDHIEAGDAVEVRTGDGQWVRRIACSGIEHGRDFLIIWVQREGHDPVPWPAGDVRPAGEADA